MNTPITDSFDRLEYPKGEYPLRGDEWVPIDDCRQIERDLMVLALRLMGEDFDTLAPETREVMERLKFEIDALLGMPK